METPKTTEDLIQDIERVQKELQEVQQVCMQLFALIQGMSQSLNMGEKAEELPTVE